MPRYTTSYPPRKGQRPHARRNDPSLLPGAHRPRKRKPGAMYLRHTQGLGGSARGRRPGTHGQGRGGRRGRDLSRRTYALIVVGCAFLVFAASVLWYVNRSVKVTVNGSEVSVRIHSTVQQLIDSEGMQLKPGRLLAVDDAVLDKTGGDACSVKLDDKEVKVERLGEVELLGGEKLEIGNGADTYEPHDVKATAIKPTLKLEGSGAIAWVKTWGEGGRSEVWTGKTSGKVKDRGVVKEAVDCVVAARSVNPSGKKKYAALTFDEAPGGSTDKILKVLEEKGVKATFFIQGNRAAANAKTVAAIAKAGHELGANAYDDVDLATLAGEKLRAQITNGFDAVAKASGSPCALLRAPFGSFSTKNWAEAMDLVGAVVGWNVDSGDWTLPGASQVANNVVDAVGNGDIVLLTDNDATSAQTAEALPAIIDGLVERGYTLVTLSELIDTDDDLKDAINLNSVNMPEGAVLPTVTDTSQAS